MAKEILKIRIDNGLGDNNPTFKDIELDDYSGKFPRMGFPDLTATLMWPTPLDNEWTHNEYVVLRGEKFYVTDTPDAEKSNSTALYKHDLGFTSEFARILGNTYFEDAVPSYSETYDKPCSNSSKFTFYGTISELCDRLNCSFIKAGIADSVLKTKTSLTTLDTPVGDGYCVMLDPYGAGDVYDPNKSYEFSWEDKSHWEAITEGFNITEIPFERRGKRIIFGATPKVVDHKFEYGHDNELLSIKHKNAKAKVVNRITMQGSSENIPHYYPNETEYGHISLKSNTDNKILSSEMMEVVNAAQLLSHLNADSTAILGKYEKDIIDNPKKDGEVSNISYAVGHGAEYDNPQSVGYISPYSVEDLRKVVTVSGDVLTWHIRVYFNVVDSGIISITKIPISTWTVNEASGGGYSNVIEKIIPEKLLAHATPDGIFQPNDISDKIQRGNNYITFGNLNAGVAYCFQFRIEIPIERILVFMGIQFFRLKNVTFGKITSSDRTKTGYYWRVGDKKYDGIGTLGVKVTASITDAMIGDGFGWTASGRMPFQDHLVPLKYRNTLGSERFYNALNMPYSEEYASEHPDAYLDPDNIDPETHLPKPYVFPNPYIEGAPSEYIYKNENIKPTIEGVCNDVQREDANGNLVFDDDGNPIYQLLGEIADIAYDADDNDSLKADSTEENDKNDSLKYEHSFFYIKLNIFNGEYGFDLFAHASQTDAMTIQMRDGSCNGCKFKIQSVKITDETGLETYKNPIVVQNNKAIGVIDKEEISESDLDPTQQNTQTHSIWICVQKDAETFGVIMPNKSNNFKPKVGDKFNIINIDLPQAYILAAEKRLEEDGMRYMLDNNEEKFTFDISASRIFFADNPQVLAQLDEYSVIKVKYNGREYEQYVNQLTIDCKSNEALPNIGIDLTDTLAVGQSFVEQVAERASSLISNPYTMGGALGGGSGGGLTTRLADLRYLKKTEADRSKGKVASDVGFEVGEFVSGGSGAILYQDPETGQTYLEVDKIKARMKAIFAELEVAKEQSIGGKFDITPGGGIDISFVEELTDSYRCYFKAKDEDKGADCRFVVGDQARCQESNIANGTSQNASNRYYWRLVTAVNNDESYIELSKTDRDHGDDFDSDAPMAGDTVVQLGNRNNPERQSAIVLSTVDAFAPCVTLYNGIDHYSLDGKSVVEYGVDKTQDPPEPFFNCYGRFFFGPKGGDSYLKFEPSVGKLIFSGELINISTLNGKDIDDYIRGVVPPVTQEDIEDYVDAIVDPKIEGIQNQIDGVIETWFYNGVPTLSNYPAIEWNNENLKIQHLGDLYYDNDTGTAYRFSQYANGNFYWNVITDDAITKALAAAQDAKIVADGKGRVFVAQPTPPYQIGDLWVNATYPTNTTKDTRDPNNNKYHLDILRCKSNKETGVFAISDWELASNYTDDTKAQQAIEEIGGFQYIRDALVNGATIFNGGLVLSQLIKLGTWNKDNPSDPTQKAVYAGMNGGYHHAKTIASWWGGDMVDKYYQDKIVSNIVTFEQRPNPLVDGYAQALIRMDGSGYLAGGNIRWDELGNLILGNGISLGGGSTTIGDVANLFDTVESLTLLFNKFSQGLVPMKLVNGTPTETNWADISSDLSNLYAVKSKKGFYSEEFISAKGLNADGGSGSGFGRLDDWSNYNANGSDALSAKLGYGLKTDIANINTRIDNLPTTSVNPYALTIQKNGTSLGTYDGSVAKTINISDVASASTLSLHTGNSTIHITAAERTKWNTTSSNLDAILGSDTDNVINKYEEIVAFLDTYTEADTLAGLLSNKADKATKISAGTGLTGGGTLASDRTLSLATSGVTAGTYTKLTVDAYGRATAGSNPTTLAGYGITDAYTKTDADNRYVNVDGDTMTGALQIDINSPTKHLGFGRASWNYICATSAGGVLAFVANGKEAGVDVNAELAILDNAVRPGSNNKVNLGVTAKRWSNVYSVLGNFSGKVTAQSVQIGDCEITWEAGKGLRFSEGIYSEKHVSARGQNSAGGGSAGNFGLLKDWPSSQPDKNGTDAISAYLGWGLKTRIETLEGKNYLNDLGISVTGTGNAVTAVTQSADKKTLTFTKGATFMTGHQPLDYLNVKDIRDTTPKPQDVLSRKAAFWFNNMDKPGGSTWYSGLTVCGWDSSAYTPWQLCANADNLIVDKNLYFRLGRTSSWEAWQKVLTSLNTKIEGGVITINGSSITPLVQHQSLDNYVTLDGVQTIKGKKTFINESRFIETNGTYADPWSGTACAIKVTGKIGVTDSIKALSFIKSGGTSSQFLKADGSVDSNSYLTTGTASSTYLPKSGGTLTGALTFSDVNPALIIKRSGGGVPYIRFSNADDNTALGEFGASAAKNPVWWTNSGWSTIWHAGNDGTGSGLDADLLDGLHESSFFSRSRGTIPTAFIDITTYTSGAADYANYAPGTYKVSRSAHSELFVNFPSTDGGSCSALQFYTSYKDADALKFRKTIDSNRVSGAWRVLISELNIGSYNAGSATKLQTTRTIWGQNFNGEGNVSGSLSSVSSIYMNRYLFMSWDTAKGMYLSANNNGELDFCSHEGYAWKRTNMHLTYDGKLGIDTTSPAYKLDVNGDIRATGWLRTSGDTGWISETYGGGWYMNESNWIRTYGNKNIYQNAGILRTDGTLQVGSNGGRFIVNATGVGINNNAPACALDVIGTTSVTGEIRAQGTNVIRMMKNEAEYAMIFRTSENSLYMIPTGKDDTLGNISALRPFQINLDSGNVTLCNGGIYVVHSTKRVGINTWGPQHELSVGGVIYASTGIYSDGYVSARGQNTSSDARLKRVTGPVNLRVADIAGAPAVRFRWRKDGKEDVGSLAQYWRGLIPELAPDMPDGSMGLQYGKTALMGLIPVARETVFLDGEIKQLKEEVKRLNKRIAQLERK